MQVFTVDGHDYVVTDEVARVLLELSARARDDQRSFEIEVPIARAVKAHGRHVVKFTIEPSTAIHVRASTETERTESRGRLRDGTSRRAPGR